MTISKLKEKIIALEQQLLAISSINDICQRSLNEATASGNLESCAELLNQLIEPAMYQVEAVRMLAVEMCQQPKIRRIEGGKKCS